MLYPTIEGVAITCGLWAGAITDGWVLVASCFFGWTLIVIAFIDWRIYRIPDVLTLPLLFAGLFVTYALNSEALIDHLIGAIAGLAIFSALSWGYRTLRGRDGLGGGDAKLLAALGAWVSYTGLPTIILLASLLALFVVLFQSLHGRRLERTTRIPFGTFLATAGWIVWLYGPLTFG